MYTHTKVKAALVAACTLSALTLSAIVAVPLLSATHSPAGSTGRAFADGQAPAVPASAVLVALDGTELANLATMDEVNAYSDALTTPCVTEESTNCYWDADVMGNGKGLSFIDVLGTAYYQPTKGN